VVDLLTKDLFRFLATNARGKLFTPTANVNILPIFPLDGGRITRDVITLVTKNKEKSIFIGSILSILASVTVGYFFFLQSGL
jgi:membrane-associated protease RseP (regulator of RpoE activity)